MKIYINESFGYGMAVAIVAANSPEEAQWLTKDIERSDFKEGHLFDVEKWHELDGTQPAYTQTEPKVLYFKEYWE